MTHRLYSPSHTVLRGTVVILYTPQGTFDLTADPEEVQFGMAVLPTLAQALAFVHGNIVTAAMWPNATGLLAGLASRYPLVIEPGTLPNILFRVQSGGLRLDHKLIHAIVPKPYSYLLAEMLARYTATTDSTRTDFPLPPLITVNGTEADWLAVAARARA